VRRGIAILFALTLGWALTTGVSTAAADTTVSLTFDDGWADQMPAKAMLAEHDMDATFYLITDRLGDPNYFTWGDVASLHSDGNEIGGHTTNHQSLTELPLDQAKAAVCDARQALLAQGYPQVSFAYPRGDNDPATEDLVEECGYLSGRDVTPTAEWETAVAETIPPLNRWAVRTPGTIDNSDSLSDIQTWITNAEALGETSDVWVPLTFHHICDPNVTDCLAGPAEDQYITPQDFDALLDWLAQREPMGTHVETMAKVIDPVPPTTSIQCDGFPCQSSYDEPVNVTVSAADNPGGSGVREIRYTTDGSDPTSSSALYTGPIRIASTATLKFRAEDNAGNVESPVKSQTIQVGFGLRSIRSLANGKAKITLDVPGPGGLEAVDGRLAGATAAGAKKSRRGRIRPTSKFVPQAGQATLVIVPSKSGKRKLRRKGKLAVPVRVTFTPVAASATTRTFKVKLRLKRRHRS
jgi:polysaccharide deacetylase/chitobiase/beta-hexosaminidase-like protein